MKLSFANIKEIGSVLFIVALASAMLFRVFCGDWPIGHDHPAHLFRIWQLREAISQHGIPWSWSHRWFTGYPQNVVYPIGTDLFVLTFQALSFGKLSIGQAYGIAFWAFYSLYGYAAYYFIRRAVGSRIAALIAVVFLLTDPGANDTGGWFWIVDIGAWTAALGMVPALIGTARMADLLEIPKERTAVVVAVCIGLALLCHLLHLIYFGIGIPLLCASRFIAGEETNWLRALALLGGASVCGLMIASFWLVPYFAATPYISELGFPGSSLAQIGAGIAGGNLFTRMHPLAMAFGLVGSLILLRARNTLPLFMALFIFLCFSLSSSSFLGLFGPAAADWLSKQMVFPRFLMLIKPFWYGTGAFLLVTSGKAIHQKLASLRTSRVAEPSERNRVLARIALAVFAGVFVVPVFFLAVKSFIHNEVLRPTQWHSQRQDLAARTSFVEWAKNELHRESGFFRIAHGFEPDEHTLTDLGIDVARPFYKIYDTPTGHFKNNYGSPNNEALRAVNVRFVLAGHPISRPDFLLERTFDDRLRWYRFRDWKPNPFEILEGAGDVKLSDFEDEQIVLEAGPGAHGLLRLNVSYFPKWRATRDGAEVAITAVPVPGVDRSAFMQVPLLPGTYRFRYGKDIWDYTGTLLCVLGVAGCLVLGNWERLRQTLRRASGGEGP